MTRKKKIHIISLMVVLTLLLGACSSAAANSTELTPTRAPAEMEKTATQTSSSEGTARPQQPAGATPGGETAESSQPQNDPTGTALAGKNWSFEPEIFNPDESVEPDPGNLDGVLVVGEKTFIKSHEDITATEDDQSAAIITGAGNLTVAYANVTTSGDTSSLSNSNFIGQNAAILAEGDSTLKVLYGNLSTSGSGANGVFATEKETIATVLDMTIDSSGDYAHAVMTTLGASMKLTNVTMTTSGAGAAAIASGRGGGTITVEDSSAVTSGSGAPGVYARGDVTISNSQISSSNSGAAVIEGAGSITATDSDFTSSGDGRYGVMFYQDSSDGSQKDEGEGSFSMTGGTLSFTGKDGPLFYVTNSSGHIQLSGVKVTVDSGLILKASASDWGESGSNGGSVLLTADDQSLTGDIIADSLSSVSIELKNGSSLTGAIGADNSARATNLTLDNSSTWTVTADSYLTNLSNADGISGSDVSNIIGNGYTVYYNKNANVDLHGKIYNLSGGGALKPLN